MHEDVCIQHANLKIKGQPRTASEVALRCLHEMPHTLNQETSTSLKKILPLYMWGDGKIGVSWCLCGGQRTTCGNSSAMLSPRNVGPSTSSNCLYVLSCLTGLKPLLGAQQLFF